MLKNVLSEPFVVVRALWRIWRRGESPFRSDLHFIPMDEVLDAGFPRSAMNRPTLCGTYIDTPGGGTTQPDIVGCWECALGIERDRKKYVPKRYPRWITEYGMTVCMTCGGVIGFLPGCTCWRKSLGQRWAQYRANKTTEAAVKAHENLRDLKQTVDAEMNKRRGSAVQGPKEKN